MPRGSPKINHLAFADDMIILCKLEIGTLQMVIDTLEKYERVSGQKINKGKSSLHKHKTVSNGTIVIAEVPTGILIEVSTGILRLEFPFNYLGCLIFS